MHGLIDASRLADTLQHLHDNIVCRRLDMISPMAVPLILQITRDNILLADEGDALLDDLEKEVIRAANVESIDRICRAGNGITSLRRTVLASAGYARGWRPAS